MALTLKEIRESKNVTISKLSKMTGIAVANIKRIEGGTQRPRAKTIKRIADALDFNYYSLFDIMKG